MGDEEAESSLLVFLGGPVRMYNPNDMDCSSREVRVNFQVSFFFNLYFKNGDMGVGEKGVFHRPLVVLDSLD